jgi:MFS family permease
VHRLNPPLSPRCQRLSTEWLRQRAASETRGRQTQTIGTRSHFLERDLQKYARREPQTLLSRRYVDGRSGLFFNAVFFTYGLVVEKIFHISDDELPLHLLPFALGSFLGPIVLGRLFDKIGRKPMITVTYGIAGLMLAAVCYPFAHGMLTAKTLRICFTAIFFVASSAASAAYLTVSEIFPLEIRASAIAIFYAIGTLLGGVGAHSIWVSHRFGIAPRSISVAPRA